MISVHEEWERSFHKFWLLWLLWSLLKPLPRLPSVNAFSSPKRTVFVWASQWIDILVSVLRHIFSWWNREQTLPHIAMHFLLHFMVAIYFNVVSIRTDRYINLIDKFDIPPLQLRSAFLGISWESDKIIETEIIFDWFRFFIVACFMRVKRLSSIFDDIILSLIQLESWIYGTRVRWSHANILRSETDGLFVEYKLKLIFICIAFDLRRIWSSSKAFVRDVTCGKNLL